MDRRVNQLSTSHSVARSHSPSPTPSESAADSKVIVGVCALDVKARSRAMREIITRLAERGKGAIEVKIFGDKVIFDEGEPHVSSITSMQH